MYIFKQLLGREDTIESLQEKLLINELGTRLIAIHEGLGMLPAISLAAGP